MREKIVPFVVYALPIFGMIGLIPFVENDYLLTAIYAVCIFTLFRVKREKHDVFALIFGFIVITIAELFFVGTGVETFSRQSLFGVMPLWLPFLWGYAFVTIKRYLNILNRAA